jgi:hypothetical protein
LRNENILRNVFEHKGRDFFLTVNVHAQIDFDKITTLDGLRRVRLKRAVVAHNLVKGHTSAEEIL